MRISIFNIVSSVIFSISFLVLIETKGQKVQFNYGITSSKIRYVNNTYFVIPKIQPLYSQFSRVGIYLADKNLFSLNMGIAYLRKGGVSTLSNIESNKIQISYLSYSSQFILKKEYNKIISGIFIAPRIDYLRGVL